MSCLLPTIGAPVGSWLKGLRKGDVVGAWLDADTIELYAKFRCASSEISSIQEVVNPIGSKACVYHSTRILNMLKRAICTVQSRSLNTCTSPFLSP